MKVWIGVVTVLGVSKGEARSACQGEVFSSEDAGKVWIYDTTAALKKEKQKEWSAQEVSVESSLNWRELSDETPSS